MIPPILNITGFILALEISLSLFKFAKYLLNTCHGLGSALGIGDITVNKPNMVPFLPSWSLNYRSHNFWIILLFSKLLNLCFLLATSHQDLNRPQKHFKQVTWSVLHFLKDHSIQWIKERKRKLERPIIKSIEAGDQWWDW